MMLQRIKSDNSMVRFFANVPGPLAVKGFVLRLTGTSAGTAVFVSDVGRVMVRRRGDVRVSADFDVLQIQNRSWFKNPEITLNGQIGAFAFSAYIPRVLAGSKDVELIEPDDNYEIEVVFGANIAAFVAAAANFRAELFADIDVGTCWYDLSIKQTQFNYPAAITSAESVSDENLFESMLTARIAASSIATLAASLLGEVSVQWGKNHGSGPIAAWQSLEAVRNPVAAASSLLGVVLHRAEGEINGALEDKLGLVFTVTGASQPIVLTTGIRFNREKQVITRATNATDLAGKLAVKDRAGHGQSSAVIRDALGVATKVGD
jgi:hypothetical protein